jgi:3-hydroxyisobutyrate dehydrogenase
MANIGFVGLGHMGLPMAINLVKAGHRVTGYDLQETARDQLAAAGGIAAHHLPMTAKQQDFIITMLQNGQQVIQVCGSADGLFALADQGTLFIDCSTIDVQSSREVHRIAGEYGFSSLDAPVSGGVAGAAAGTLTFMVGGTEAAYLRGEPVLSTMGKKTIHTGQAGSGQAAKICNNMVLGISMVAISEAFTLAKQLGLSAEKLFEVINNSSGQCWALSQYVPVPGILEKVPANHDYQPGFAAAMMLKDLLLSQQAAQDAEVTTPLGEQTTRLYQNLIDQGLGHLDFSAIIKLIAGHGVV